MQLAKQKIVQVNVVESVLSDNFRKIESEFRRMKREIENIKKNETSIIDKLNQLDPFDQLDMYEVQHTEKQIEIGREGERKQNDHKQDISRIQPIKQSSEVNENSVTIMEMKKNLDEIERKNRKNESRETDRSLIQNRNIINEKIIKDMLRRLDEQEQISMEREDRIDKLENDNGLFRKNFGMKQVKRPKTTNLGKISQEKKIQKKESVSMKSVESEKNKEKDEEEISFIYKLSKEVNEIRQYLAGKIKSMDSQIIIINDKLDGYKVELNKKGEEESDMKNLKEEEERTEKENDNHMKGQTKFGQRIKTTQDTNSRVLNETMESYRAHYEDKIIEIFDEMDNLKRQYLQIVQKMTEENQGDKENEKDNEKLKNIAKRIGISPNNSLSKEVEENLKKELNIVKRDYKSFRQEFSDLINGVNNGNNETRTLVIKPNETKQDWKNLSHKIYKAKQEMMSAVKEMDNKITANNDYIVTLNDFEVSLGELKIMLNRKMDSVQVEKTIKRLESRLNNFIRQICEKQGVSQQQEPSIVRQPWFCLSCDSEIKNYTGKVGKTVYNEKFVGKKVNPQSHMIRRNDNGRLPSLH